MGTSCCPLPRCSHNHSSTSPNDNTGSEDTSLGCCIVYVHGLKFPFFSFCLSKVQHYYYHLGDDVSLIVTNFIYLDKHKAMWTDRIKLWKQRAILGNKPQLWDALMWKCWVWNVSACTCLSWWRIYKDYLHHTFLIKGPPTQKDLRVKWCSHSLCEAPREFLWPQPHGERRRNTNSLIDSHNIKENLWRYMFNIKHLGKCDLQGGQFIFVWMVKKKLAK